MTIASILTTSSWNRPSLSSRQMELLKGLVSKHMTETEIEAFASADDLAVTSFERGVARWEHSHLVAALDTLNNYQRTRRAQICKAGPSLPRRYRSDARTRLIELLKRWLRTHAADANLREDDVRRVTLLCHDILYHGEVFPARNTWSFLHTMEMTYSLLQKQLNEILLRDRSCVALVTEALCTARNLISDAIAFLLTGPTDLKQSDMLPSMEVVSLWVALPATLEKYLPPRPVDKLQTQTQDLWKSNCGSMIAALLCSHGARRLFGGRAVNAGTVQSSALALPEAPWEEPSEDASAPPEPVMPCIEQARSDFAAGKFRHSGLAGPFRRTDRAEARHDYLAAVQCVYDLLYLFGRVLGQFGGIGDCLGDFGMVRMSTWLHPFLSILEQKINSLKGHLENLNHVVEDAVVLAKARGMKVEGPLPTPLMAKRAYQAIDRAVLRTDSHCQALLTSLEQLRARSDPSRLPRIQEQLADAGLKLQAMLTSEQFRAHVGELAFTDFQMLVGPAARGFPNQNGLMMAPALMAPAMLQDAEVETPDIMITEVEEAACANIEIEDPKPPTVTNRDLQDIEEKATLPIASRNKPNSLQQVSLWQNSRGRGNTGLRIGAFMMRTVERTSLGGVGRVKELKDYGDDAEDERRQHLRTDPLKSERLSPFSADMQMEDELPNRGNQSHLYDASDDDEKSETNICSSSGSEAKSIVLLSSRRVSKGSVGRKGSKGSKASLTSTKNPFDEDVEQEERQQQQQQQLQPQQQQQQQQQQQGKDSKPTEKVDLIALGLARDPDSPSAASPTTAATSPGGSSIPANRSSNNNTNSSLSSSAAAAAAAAAANPPRGARARASSLQSFLRRARGTPSSTPNSDIEDQAEDLLKAPPKRPPQRSLLCSWTKTCSAADPNGTPTPNSQSPASVSSSTIAKPNSRSFAIGISNRFGARLRTSSCDATFQST